jgi:hypothetical protein
MKMRVKKMWVGVEGVCGGWIGGVDGRVEVM